ncbi:MAG: serine/threonine protein kinase, partial [Myxococcales bacterium]
ILPHLAEDLQFVEMFLNEARLAASLNHPNIVQIFDLGETNGAYFIAMEYIDGPNLRGLCRKAVEQGKHLPFEHAAKIIALACEGLGYAHDFAEDGQPLNLIHRDISPDNILLTRQGAVKVVDFGIAKAANQGHLTKTGTLKGKLAYMPPEQLKGKPLDRRADIFALGVVLYELVAGLKPFDSTSEVATMQAILYEAPVPVTDRRPDCPPELVAIINKALEKDREQRYADCRSLQRDLEKFILSRGATIGAYELAAVVSEIIPAQPVPLQTTPGPRAAPEPTVPPTVVPQRGPPAEPPTMIKPAAPDRRDPLAPPIPAESRPQTGSRPAPVFEDEPLPPRTASSSGKAGLVALIAGIAILSGGGAWFFATRSAPPAPVEPVASTKAPEPVKPPEPPKAAEPEKAPEPPTRTLEPVVLAVEPPREEPKPPEPRHETKAVEPAEKKAKGAS